MTTVGVAPAATGQPGFNKSCSLSSEVRGHEFRISPKVTGERMSLIYYGYICTLVGPVLDRHTIVLSDRSAFSEVQKVFVLTDAYGLHRLPCPRH
jgi:hypothetical protein